jgi:hypothetical protein
MRPPAKGQVDVFDGGYPGLALRVSYGGRKAWVNFYRWQRKQKRLRLGAYPSTSRRARFLARGASALDLGQDPEVTLKRPTQAAEGIEAPAAAANLFEHVLLDWLNSKEGQKTRYETERLFKREVGEKWKGRPIASITKREALDVVKGIVERGKMTMARRFQAWAHAFFAWCVEQDLVERNPLADVRKPGKNVERDRVFVEIDEEGVIDEEIGELHWNEIQGDRLVFERVRTEIQGIGSSLSACEPRMTNRTLCR